MPKPKVREGTFDKVNFVIDSWVTGCNAPWYIYIETMGPAALEAFIVLISFGWADVLRGTFRPKGLGRRTSKRKGKWAKRVPRFPEIGNTLGKGLPIGEQIDDFVKWGANTKFLWRIDNALQAGLFLWLVADVAEDFAFNWTSLLYENYWCQPDPPGRFSWHDPDFQNTGSGSWRKKSYRVKDYGDLYPTWNGFAGNSGPNGCTAVATCTWKPFGIFPPPTKTGIMIYASIGPAIFAQTGPDDVIDPAETRMVCKGDIPPWTLFRVAVYHEPHWALVGDGVVMAVETKDN